MTAASIAEKANSSNKLVLHFNPESLSFVATAPQQTPRANPSPNATDHRVGNASAGGGAPGGGATTGNTPPQGQDSSGGSQGSVSGTANQPIFTADLNSPKPGTVSFDAWFRASGGDEKKVWTDTQMLIGWTTPRTGVNPDGSNPDQPTLVPLVFTWGQSFSTDCTLGTANISYYSFSSNGYPLVAKVHIELKLTTNTLSKTNPTSGGLLPIGSHVLRAGDTLASIAFSNYGAAGYWRPLARANDIDDPLRVRPGTVIQLPARSELVNGSAP